MRKLFPLLFLLCFATSAFAQSLSALMNEAMDKQVSLNLSGPLPTAMKQIADSTGVRLEADRAVWDLLPWGEQTNLTARIENQTLREALTGITQKLGLTFELKEQFVQLQPSPALRRLGRRATVVELRALDVLTSTLLNLQADRPTVKQLVDAVDDKLEAIDAELIKAGKPALGLAIEYRSADTVLQDQTVPLRRTATLADALEALAAGTRATWYPWGKSVVIVPKEDQVRNQLGKTVTVRYNNVDISQVLTELAQAAGVEFTIQPGAVQNIPADFRKVNLLLDNASIKQALEQIAGYTGLSYTITEAGVTIAAATGAGGKAEELIALPSADGVQIFVPVSALPPDLRDAVRAKSQAQMELLRDKLKAEGFRPATQPAR